MREVKLPNRSLCEFYGIGTSPRVNDMIADAAGDAEDAGKLIYRILHDSLRTVHA